MQKSEPLSPDSCQLVLVFMLAGFLFLVLVLAEVNGTAGLGPIGAMGIFMAMTFMLTMLPAALVVVGSAHSGWVASSFASAQKEAISQFISKRRPPTRFACTSRLPPR